MFLVKNEASQIQTRNSNQRLGKVNVDVEICGTDIKIIWLQRLGGEQPTRVCARSKKQIILYRVYSEYEKAQSAVAFSFQINMMRHRLPYSRRFEQVLRCTHRCYRNINRSHRFTYKRSTTDNNNACAFASIRLVFGRLNFNVCNLPTNVIYLTRYSLYAPRVD